VPTERSFVTVRFGAGSFFCGGDGEGAGDGAVVVDQIDPLRGDGDAKVRHMNKDKV